MNKRFLAGAGVLIGLALLITGCGKAKGDVALESVVPEKSDVAFGFDYSNQEQVALLKGLLAQFPKESYKQISDEFNKSFSDQNNAEVADYFSLLKPFIGSDWKVVGGVVVDENKADGLNEVVLAGKFAKADEFQDFVVKMITKSGKKFIESKKDGVKFWENARDEVFIARSGDVFLISNGRNYLDDALGRLNGGDDGFAGTDNYKRVRNLSAKSMAFVYMSDKFIQTVNRNSGQESMGTGSAYGVMLAESKGIRVLANRLVGEGKAVDGAASDGGVKVDFFSKLPDQDVILFSQVSGLIDDLAGTIGATGVESIADYKELFNAPLALVVSDKGQLYPAVSLYFDIGTGNGELAKTFLNKMDGYADDVIAEFDSTIAGSGYEGLGLLKREVEVIKGAPIRKLYFDFSVIPEELLNGVRVYLPALDFKSLKVEFYYGVDSNGMLFFALYPGLEEEVKATLSGNEVMKNAFGALNMKEFDTRNYFDFSPLFVILDKYAEMAKGSQFVDSVKAVEGEKIYLLVKDFMETLGYVVGGSKTEDGVLKSESYLKIESVVK